MSEDLHIAQEARLVSDAHALMALGAVSAVLHSRIGEAPFPEPPEWLALWQEAIEVTRPDAQRELRERAAAQPSHEERLEVESIAQAHYEAYSRLNHERNPAPIAWEALPDDRRALMMATVADMLAGGAILVGPQAAHPKGSREVVEMTPTEAADLYLWAIDDGERTPPSSSEEMTMVGSALVKLVEHAGPTITDEPVEL